jgi:beta-fructofuranosidase
MIAHNSNVSYQSGKYVLGDNAYALMNRLPASAKISVKATANQATTGFGIALGACGTQDEVYAIRLDLQNQLLKMDKETVNNGTTTTQTITQVPLTVPVDRVFDIQLVLEKSVVTVYVNSQVALTNRIYKMNQNPWMLFVDNGWVDFENLSAKSQ